MKSLTLPAAMMAGLLSLALPSLSLAQEGVAWNSLTDGTISTSTVTATGFMGGASISTSNFSSSFYSFSPLSASQDAVNYGADNNWSVDFAPALPGGVLWYGSFIRGAGGFPPAGADVEYTFNHTPVIVSGFASAFVAGNTFSAPASTFHSGILMFSGSIDTLTCTTNATGISFQSMTLGTVPSLSGPIGAADPGCTSIANSSGAAGTMSGFGQLDVLQNDCVLTAGNLPLNQFCLLVTSQTATFVPASTINSNGNLCLGGAVGRYNSQLMSSGTSGTAEFTVDLTAIPLGTGPVAVNPGETWYFQTWHRDSVGLGSNFTDSICIPFQ